MHDKVRFEYLYFENSQNYDIYVEPNCQYIRHQHNLTIPFPLSLSTIGGILSSLSMQIKFSFASSHINESLVICIFVARKSKPSVFSMLRQFLLLVAMLPMVLNNLSIDEELQDCKSILMANACIHCYLIELFLGFFFVNFYYFSLFLLNS